MQAPFSPWIDRVSALLRSLGPYAAIELLLPGGSIIALLIWLYRRRASGTASTHRGALNRGSSLFQRAVGAFRTMNHAIFVTPGVGHIGATVSQRQH